MSFQMVSIEELTQAAQAPQPPEKILITCLWESEGVHLEALLEPLGDMGKGGCRLHFHHHWIKHPTIVCAPAHPTNHDQIIKARRLKQLGDTDVPNIEPFYAAPKNGVSYEEFEAYTLEFKGQAKMEIQEDEEGGWTRQFAFPNPKVGYTIKRQFPWWPTKISALSPDGTMLFTAIYSVDLCGIENWNDEDVTNILNNMAPEIKERVDYLRCVAVEVNKASKRIIEANIQKTQTEERARLRRELGLA